MASDVPDDLIVINDPEVDVEAIMATIRARVQQRRDELGYDGRVFPTFGGTAMPAEPTDMAHDANLYHHLRMANSAYVIPTLQPVLPPSPASRVPILGTLWQRIRPALHALILVYVNQALSSQV